MIDFVTIPKERMKFLKNDKLLPGLKKLTNAKIKFADEIEIDCDDPLILLRVKEIIRAAGRGFSLKDAMNLLDESFVLETITLTDFAGKSKKRQLTLKGRVIGRQGTMKEFVEKHGEVKVSIYGKTISIVGLWDRVPNAREAIVRLLNGAKHTSVYRFLEERELR